MSFRTVKPAQLGLLFRTVERQRKIYACVTVLALSEAAATADAPSASAAYARHRLRTEASLWKTLALHAPEFTEAGIVKSQPEYLVFGHAHGYDGSNEGVAGVRFAGRAKWLRSFGPRRHPDALQPTPLTRVPLHWRHAYGGPAFARNPLGTGHGKGDDGRIVLPQLEMPEAPWRPGDEAQQPAGFGPLDVTHPDRQKLVGTYDADWLKTEFPAMARDADWRFFQVAPLDQRLPADLRGDESYDFMGLHPSERVQRARLPGIRPRVFAERKLRSGALKEIECKLRTVVFLTDADAVLQIWQGITPVADEDASELAHLIAGFEAIDAPRPAARYAEIFASRLDEQDGMLAMLRDEELLPDGMGFEALIPTDVDFNRPPPADSLEARLAKRHLERVESARAEVVALGLDPDLHAPALPPPREVIPPTPQLGEYFRQLDVRAAAQRAEAEAARKKLIDDHTAEFAARGESFDYVLKEMTMTPTGPPLPRAPGLIAELGRTHAALGSNATSFGEVAEMLADEPLQAGWHANDRAMQGLYERSAHFQSAAPRTTGAGAARQREWVVQRLAAYESLKGLDLTGADLGGLDLRGARLDGALLEGASFEGVDLSGASAKGATLAHASFVNARADRCDFSGANLGNADFSGASLAGADLSRTILWGTDFAGAAMQGACVRDAECLHVKLAGADLSEAVLDDVVFYRTDLTGTRLVRASLEGAQFVEATLDRTDFSGAQARAVVFVKPSGEGLSFDGADLTNARFVQEPRLPRASMRDATLTKAFAHGADFSGADFAHATLDGAELGGSDLRGASLRGVRARDTGLRFADLGAADVVGADLRGALLGNARLHGARFEASSFFMADLARVQIDTATRFDHANLGRARLYPRWEPPT